MSWTESTTPASRAMFNENVRLNNALRDTRRRLESIAVMHVSRIDRDGGVLCAVCLLPFPCATATIARGGE